MVGHRRKEKLLFYVQVEYMCNEKLVVDKLTRDIRKKYG